MTIQKIENWLEDSSSGRFSRYAAGKDDSTWVCNECGESDADPNQFGCKSCGADAEDF